MPPSIYCFAHILQDTNQKLFKACAYNSPEGVTCTYPILYTQKPPYCNGHIDLMGLGNIKKDTRGPNPNRKRKSSEDKTKGKSDIDNPEKTAIINTYSSINDLIHRIQTQRKILLQEQLKSNSTQVASTTAKIPQTTQHIITKN